MLKNWVKQNCHDSTSQSSCQKCSSGYVSIIFNSLTKSGDTEQPRQWPWHLYQPRSVKLLSLTVISVPSVGTSQLIYMSLITVDVKINVTTVYDGCCRHVSIRPIRRQSSSLSFSRTVPGHRSRETIHFLAWPTVRLFVDFNKKASIRWQDSAPPI